MLEDPSDVLLRRPERPERVEAIAEQLLQRRAGTGDYGGAAFTAIRVGSSAK